MSHEFETKKWRRMISLNSAHVRHSKHPRYLQIIEINSHCTCQYHPSVIQTDLIASSERHPLLNAAVMRRKRWMLHRTICQLRHEVLEFWAAGDPNKLVHCPLCLTQLRRETKLSPRMFRSARGTAKILKTKYVITSSVRVPVINYWMFGAPWHFIRWPFLRRWVLVWHG